ncbi:bifunctional lysylphosphatidylglycerol flippase/synthetase MprF [Paenibacillus sp. 1182]|uniref:bifunctional lysylphosphatidylglycerol flippase/synthetase MprF n=1 Tax=unclassified Paenibacillus TaxID=185978 RepID=UPI001AE8E305|nr:bifunctional lysylphosphatidylglycerol flippase/synthetase MprF [Paenibacillus sp. 1182]MBP1309398.1 phosphatidylglycerol lysyltransferase [Paenibacillus sp. 1182]
MKSNHKPTQSFKIVQFLMTIYRQRLTRILLPLAVLAFIIWEAGRELNDFNLARMFHELRRMDATFLIEIGLFSLAAVAAMSAYDYVIRHHFKLQVKPGTTFRYAWISNTFNNVFGFAGFTGAGLRTVLYKKSGVPLGVITSAVVFLSPVVITGLSLLAWGAIVHLYPVQPVLDAHPWLHWALWGMALYLPLFLIMQRSKRYSTWFNKGEGQLSWSTISASISASLLEWLLAGLTFAWIGSHLLHELPIHAVFGIYVIAAIAGLISLAPGGVGAFDIIALLGLQMAGADSDRALAVLLVFRVFYYIIPWLIGLVLAALEMIPRNERLNQLAETGWDYSLNAWQKVWGWPGQFRFLADLGVWALGKLVLISGVVLLLSAATPGLLYRLRFAEHLLSLPVMRLSHEISVIIGIMLVVLSHGISLRIRRALRLTLVLLLTGAIFTFTKGLDFEEALFLLFVALMLWISRSRFYRVSAPLNRHNILIWGGLSLLVTGAYFIIGAGSNTPFMRHLHAKVHLDFFMNRSDYGVTAVFSLILAWVFLTVYFFLRPQRSIANLPDEQELDKLKEFLERQGGNLVSHMLFLGDKYLYWTKNEQVVIPYARSRDKLIVLGDPLGPKERVSEAIQEFQRFADRYALTAVFYQASPEYLSIYHENGYRFFKLGEEALVPLESFTLTGKSNQALRSAKNRFDREGYSFEIIQPPLEASLIEEMRHVSNIWLDGRKEKGYSLGWFKESYLQLAPIALLKDSEGKVIAFATMAPAYDHGQTVSIDLMRHLPDTPNGTMDYLFTRVIEWAKESGYTTFNLGMAPLSQVGQSEKALREEKLARLVFQYGGHFYGFQGLRRFKDKFKPQWEPRYLAYPASVFLPILTLELVYLVSKRSD